MARITKLWQLCRLGPQCHAVLQHSQPALYAHPATASQAHGRLWWALAIAAATTGATAAALGSASCEDATPKQRMQLAALHNWLAQHGAGVSGITFERTAVRIQRNPTDHTRY